jgi:hypothetical protein
MVTKLEKPLKREILIKDRAYVVTITPQGLKLTIKGHRKGHELAWESMVPAEDAEGAADDPPETPGP